MPPLFINPEVLSAASDKSKLFAKTTPLPSFPSQTYLKLHNISVSPKMVKNFITNLDS